VIWDKNYYSVYADGLKDANTRTLITLDNDDKVFTSFNDANFKEIDPIGSNLNQYIESGEGSYSNSSAYQLVNHGTSDTTFTLTPNILHVWDNVDVLTLTLGDEIAGIVNEYFFQFTSGSEPTTLILPDSIKFNSDFTVEENNIYQISILNGLGTVMSWEFTPSIVFPVTLEIGDNGDIGISLYSYLQSTYGEPTSGTILNEEIINNYNGVVFGTIEYGTYTVSIGKFTGYWLDGYKTYAMSWVLLEDGYLQRVLPPDTGGAE
jgi:hypothetical protein